MSSGVIVESIAEVKKFVVLGFCEVEGMKIPALACLKFIIFFCKYGDTPPVGYKGDKKKVVTGSRTRSKLGRI